MALSEQRFSEMQAWVLGLTSVASLMVVLDMLVVTTALSTIRLDLRASLEELEWIVNAYSLSFAVLLMTGAALGDRFGRRRVFVIGLALFTLSSAACALASDIGWLIAARAVQGASAALVMPLALALLSAAFPPERRGKALGLASGIAGLAVIGGPLLGGGVTEGFSWEWIFWLNVPIGIVLIPLVLSKVDEGFGPAQAIDTLGLVLFSGAAFGVVWALVRGNAAGWGSPEVLLALIAGGVLAVGFVVWELLVPAPMLPLALFRSRAFASGNAAGFLLFATLVSAVFFVAQYLQIPLGYSPFEAGLRVLPWTALILVVAPLSGAMVDRVGERPLLVSGLILQAIGIGWIGVIAEPDLSYGPLVLPLAIAGLGVALAMPAAQNAVVGAVDPSNIGKASGTFNMLRQLGAVFGVAILAAVFSASGGYTNPEEFTDGFRPALVAGALLSAAGAVAGLGTARRSRVGTLEQSPRDERRREAAGHDG